MCPPGIIRPAMDRMRESMFAVLGPLERESFLDLFSGSGLVGLEAWSRGARPVVLVEKDRGKPQRLESLAGASFGAGGTFRGAQPIRVRRGVP